MPIVITDKSVAGTAYAPPAMYVYVALLFAFRVHCNVKLCDFFRLVVIGTTQYILDWLGTHLCCFALNKLIRKIYGNLVIDFRTIYLLPIQNRLVTTIVSVKILNLNSVLFVNHKCFIQFFDYVIFCDLPFTCENNLSAVIIMADS